MHLVVAHQTTDEGAGWVVSTSGTRTGVFADRDSAIAYVFIVASTSTREPQILIEILNAPTAARQEHP